MKINCTSQVSYYSNNEVTRRHLERTLPKDAQLASLLQDTVGDSVSSMLTNIGAASDRSRDKQVWGTLAAVGGGAAAAIAAYNSSLPVAAAAGCVGAIGAAFALVGRNGVQRAAKQSQLLQTRAQLANQALVAPSADGKTFEDRRFSDMGAFFNPREVRESGSGNVLERHIEIGSEQPVLICENVARGSVTIKTGDQESTFPGSLRLPSLRFPQACVTRENLDLPHGEEQMYMTELSFNSQGKADLLLTSDTSYDSEGFSYTNTLGARDRYASVAVHPDKTLYLNRGDVSFAVKSPVDLGPLAQATPDARADRVTYASDLAGLSFHYSTSKPTLEPMQAAVLKVEPDPVAATFAPAEGSKVEFTRVGGQWEARASDGRTRSFEGELDRKGNIKSGSLTQKLSGRDLNLTSKVPHGSVTISHPQGQTPTASYWLTSDTRVEAQVQVSPEGNYSVTQGGQTYQIAPPVPAAWL